MRIKLEYRDTDSYVAQEAIVNLKNRHGPNCEVHAMPDNDTPEAYIHFAIRELISVDQLETYFEYSGQGYEVEIQRLKDKVLDIVSKQFDAVIRENEKRLE